MRTLRNAQTSFFLMKSQDPLKDLGEELPEWLMRLKQALFANEDDKNRKV